MSIRAMFVGNAPAQAPAAPKPAAELASRSEPETTPAVPNAPAPQPAEPPTAEKPAEGQPRPR